MLLIFSHPSWLNEPKSGFMIIFQVSIRSCAVNASPLWKVAPWRNLNV